MNLTKQGTPQKYKHFRHTLILVEIQGGQIFKSQGGGLNFEFYCIFIKESQKISQIFFLRP